MSSRAKFTGTAKIEIGDYRLKPGDVLAADLPMATRPSAGLVPCTQDVIDEMSQRADFEAVGADKDEG